MTDGVLSISVVRLFFDRKSEVMMRKKPLSLANLMKLFCVTVCVLGFLASSSVVFAGDQDLSPIVVTPSLASSTSLIAVPVASVPIMYQQPQPIVIVVQMPAIQPSVVYQSALPATTYGTHLRTTTASKAKCDAEYARYIRQNAEWLSQMNYHNRN